MQQGRNVVQPSVAVRILPESLIAELIDFPEVIDLVEQAFANDAKGRHQNYAVVRAPLRGDIPGIFGVKTGYLPDQGYLGLKAGGYWRENRRAGVSTHQSTMLLFEPESGRAIALIAANAITGYRTGAAGAIGIRHLARPNATRVGVIGCGQQGRMQLRALLAIREITQVTIWDHHRTNAEQLIADLTTRFPNGPSIVIADDAETLVRESDIVITATPGGGPVVQANWVQSGTHISAIGSDTAGKQELDPAILDEALVVADNRIQSATLGEVQHAGPGFDRTTFPELGEIIAGLRPGRTDDDQITVFDATGVTFQDLIVAGYLWREAVARDLGQTVRLD